MQQEIHFSEMQHLSLIILNQSPFLVTPTSLILLAASLLYVFVWIVNSSSLTKLSLVRLLLVSVFTLFEFCSCIQFSETTSQEPFQKPTSSLILQTRNTSHNSLFTETNRLRLLVKIVWEVSESIVLLPEKKEILYVIGDQSYVPES